MIKGIVVVVCLSCITVNLYAEIKWIPIKPINENENSNATIKVSQLQPVNKLFENVKIFQRLLDAKSAPKVSNTDDKKNWYPIKDIQTH